MKRGILVILAVILLSRVALGIYLFFDSGSFFMLTGDDVARTQLAYTFSKNTIFSPHLIWPPLPFWIMGFALRLYPNLLIIPATVNTVFTIGTIIVLYYLTQILYNRNYAVSLSCAAAISFIPWLVWLSLSGLSESIYHFFVLLGILFWCLYVKNQKRSMLLISSLGFAFCTMVRFEGWPLLSLFTLSSVRNVLRKKDKLDCPLIVIVSLGWIFIFLYLLDQHIRFGNPLNSIHWTRLEMAGGWTTPQTFLGKFLYYPLELLRFSPPTVILSFVGLLTSWVWTRKYIVLVLFQLLVLSLMASLSGVATNTPIRIIFTTYIQLIPLASYGLYSVLKLLRKTWLINLSLAMLILLICSHNISNISYYRLQPKLESVQVGRLMKDITTDRGWKDSYLILVEEGGCPTKGNTAFWMWDPLTIFLFLPDKIVVKKDIDPDEIQRYKVAVIHSQNLIEKIEKEMIMASSVGEYKLFVSRGDDVLLQIIRNLRGNLTRWANESFGNGEIFVEKERIIAKTSKMNLSAAKARWIDPFPPGDFEVEVDFSILSFPRPSRERIEADIAVEVEGDRYAIGRWLDASGLDAYWMWDGRDPNTYIPSTDTTGKLRARRIGSTLYGDLWDGMKWVNIGSRPIKNGTAYVSLTVFNSTSRKKVEVQFSNFRVVSGETLFSKYYSTQDSVALNS